MTNPTADAAKLLPCPFCGSEAKVERHYRAMPYDPHDGLGHSGGGVVDETPYCQNEFCRASRPSADAWNTRPQPAPPTWEPDQIRRALSIAKACLEPYKVDSEWCLHNPGHASYNLCELAKACISLGLAVRPKVEDAALDVWKKQYGAALSDPIVQEDEARHLLTKAYDLLERLAGERDELRRALSREQTSGVARVAFDQICQERDGLEVKLAATEAELAKVDAVVNAMTGSDFYTYGGWGERQRNLTEWYEQSVARQQAAKDKSKE